MQGFEYFISSQDDYFDIWDQAVNISDALYFR